MDILNSRPKSLLLGRGVFHILKIRQILMALCLNVVAWGSLSFPDGIHLNRSLARTRLSGDSQVGKKAAARYFAERAKALEGSGEDKEGEKKGEGEQRSPAAVKASTPRYLSLQVGTYLDEDYYKWGKGNRDNSKAGQLTAGVSYRVGEWVQSMDLLLRVDFNSYKFDEARVLKMSMMPLVTFPDVKSGFPLYFGGGAGVGVFFKQLRDESSLSLDYQLVMGLRLLRLIGETGLVLETGMKNHVHLLSDGQYNGVFLTLGAAFNF